MNPLKLSIRAAFIGLAITVSILPPCESRADLSDAAKRGIITGGLAGIFSGCIVGSLFSSTQISILAVGGGMLLGTGVGALGGIYSDHRASSTPRPPRRRNRAPRDCHRQIP